MLEVVRVCNVDQLHDGETYTLQRRIAQPLGRISLKMQRNRRTNWVLSDEADLAISLA